MIENLLQVPQLHVLSFSYRENPPILTFLAETVAEESGCPPNFFFFFLTNKLNRHLDWNSQLKFIIRDLSGIIELSPAPSAWCRDVTVMDISGTRTWRVSWTENHPALGRGYGGSYRQLPDPTEASGPRIQQWESHHQQEAFQSYQGTQRFEAHFQCL